MLRHSHLWAVYCRRGGPHHLGHCRLWNRMTLFWYTNCRQTQRLTVFLIWENKWSNSFWLWGHCHVELIFQTDKQHVHQWRCVNVDRHPDPEWKSLFYCRGDRQMFFKAGETQLNILQSWTHTQQGEMETCTAWVKSKLCMIPPFPLTIPRTPPLATCPLRTCDMSADITCKKEEAFCLFCLR